MNNFTIIADPFALILQRIDQHPAFRDNTHDVYLFQDNNHNHFFLKRQNLGTSIPSAEYLYVRGIRCICHFYEIMLTPTGRILALPPQLASAYNQAMNYCALHRFNERFLINNAQSSLLSKLTTNTPPRTPLLELSKLAATYENRASSRDQLRLEDLYFIEATVIGFSGNLHMFHTEHQLILHTDFLGQLSDDEKRYFFLT